MEDELPNQGEDEFEINVANPPTNKEKTVALTNEANEEEATEQQGQNEFVTADENNARDLESAEETAPHSEEQNEPAVANENSLEGNGSPEESIAETAGAPKFCTKCGTPLHEAAAFCAKCGNPADKTDNKESTIAPAKPERENNSGRTKEKASFIKKSEQKRLVQLPPSRS